MARAIPYADAIKWIVENDDTEWVEDESGSTSVSAALVADIYGKTDDVVKQDIRRAANKMRADIHLRLNQG
jgi:hypothetical protein